ncbi:hypothetical protein HOLleu_01210 [Holothuria leucospilota]|uniref:Uncharacterized protein n=1 Tax=Holothuria leucospilota TaxID=206669 RepID=A0A9Q1HKT4_HOLLE|nr:hypothetical protein HOLleu_01210 [Holothuria leucospilota]
MWSACHSLCCSSEMRSKWAAVLETVHLQREDDVDVFLLQHLLEYLHDRMLTDVMKTDKPPSLSTLKPQTMDKHEEQALRYAVGYAPFKLMKNFKKMEKNESASKCVKVLQQWAEESGYGPKDDVSYTKDWLQSQDRGKLFKVNDSVYHFFRSLEYVTRTVVKVDNVASLRKNNIITLLLTTLKSNTNVIKCWNTIVGDSIDSALSSVLLDETLTCFGKMRCNAFVKAYLDSVSRKAQKGLRKELSQSPQPSK